MPDPLRKTGDIPTYDSYPAPSVQEPGVGKALYDQPLEDIGRPESQTARKLNATAERVGNAIGNAVGAVRRRLEVVPRRIDEAKERLSEAGGDMREDVRAAAAEWKQTAQRRLTDARIQARSYAYEKPFHVVGAAAALGLAVGVGLRIWRSRNE
jgi:ElaB/YqjD/DUF883 family membrane-anchored ribosome-binding protein